MKKLNLILLSILIIVLAVSCEQKVEYSVGSKGPAGGWIFYDCDADNDTGNADGLVSSECGWRFLEAAPADIAVDSTTTFVFGYRRTTSDGSNLFANGTTSYGANCTDIAIGTGKANTEKLVCNMGSEAYTATSGAGTTANYAAKLCDDCTLGGFDDWFLPSREELSIMYTNLKSAGLGNFTDTYYWSSSENYSHPNATYAWGMALSNGNMRDSGRYDVYCVRAVRAFQ